MDVICFKIAYNVESIAVVSGLPATKLQARTNIKTNKNSTADNIQPRITAILCYMQWWFNSEKL